MYKDLYKMYIIRYEYKKYTNKRKVITDYKLFIFYFSSIIILSTSLFLTSVRHYKQIKKVSHGCFIRKRYVRIRL